MKLYQQVLLAMGAASGARVPVLDARVSVLGPKPMPYWDSESELWAVGFQIANHGQEKIFYTINWEPTKGSEMYGNHGRWRSKSEVEENMNQELERMFNSSGAEYRRIMIRYNGLEVENLGHQLARISKCLTEHAEACEYDGWARSSRCRPKVVATRFLNHIGLDYTNTFPNCTRADVEADIRFVTSIVDIEKMGFTDAKPGPSVPKAETFDPELSRFGIDAAAIEAAFPGPESVTGAPIPTAASRQRDYPKDPMRPLQWSLDFEDLPRFDSLSAPSWVKPRIGLISTGVDLIHPDLAVHTLPSRDPPVGNYWTNKKEWYGIDGVDDDENGYVDDKLGWTGGQVGQHPYGQSSRGTELAGIMTALSDNRQGITGITRNQAELVICQRNSEPANLTSLQFDIDCFDWLLKVGVNVILYDGTRAASEAQKMTDEEASLWRTVEGWKVPVITPTIDTTHSYLYPACWDSSSVTTVASINRNHQLAGRSNANSCVDLGAPGGDILTTVHHYYNPGGEQYKNLTSHTYGAAWLAGAVALNNRAFPWFTNRSLKEALAGPGLVKQYNLSQTRLGGYVKPYLGLHQVVSEMCSFWCPYPGDQTSHWSAREVIPRSLEPGETTTLWVAARYDNSTTYNIDGGLLIRRVEETESGGMREVSRQATTFQWRRDRTVGFTGGLPRTPCFRSTDGDPVVLNWDEPASVW